LLILDLLIAAAIALGSAMLTCRALIGAPIVDMPNEARKLHRAPTPTSGGIGIALGFALSLMAISLFSLEWRHEISAYGVTISTVGAAFSYGFLMLGFVDDAAPLGPRLKFVIFAALSIGAAASVGVVRALPFGTGSIELAYPAALMGTALWVFTLVNCVNFMDGANGLAMGSVAIGLGALAALGVAFDAPSGAAMAACAAGALLGFLVWNFPEGRLFAGDSGALFTGAIAALVSLVLIERAQLSPYVPPILFFPLLADALLTLAWRARRRRSLLDGHSEHLYQIAQRAGWGRRRIAAVYWLAMAVCAMLGAAVAYSPDGRAGPAVITGLVILALIISALVRRAAGKAGIAEI
jgi:UDP-GlcNAc:undecaprenyl-phosphate/decaprenyl-phosphate GlcNAc-1-phosphate transferase